MQVKSEIIFDKSKKNLKKIYNRINNRPNDAAKFIGVEEVIFLAMGGYNRTYELLLEMGLAPTEIATFSSLKMTGTFVEETHMKKVLFIKKINYLTKMDNYGEATQRHLNLNVADDFEESLLIYKHARRYIGVGSKRADWIKPTIVVMDDPSLNLQFNGHRLRYADDIGFAQVRNRNANPLDLIAEIRQVEAADRMMFAMYQKKELDDQIVMDSLNQLRMIVEHEVDGEWYVKPSEFKRVAGSLEVANGLKEIEELEIRQLKSNKRIGNEVSRWVVIPEKAFNFKGFEYKDDAEIFKQELEEEEERDRVVAEQQERLINEIMSVEIPLNIKIGYVGSEMAHSGNVTLQTLVDETDELTKALNSLALLDGASTKEEYDGIKATALAYFLDGTYSKNQRNDDNYEGGKRLVVLDVDDGDYSRTQIEDKLETNGLFGLIYPTARYYYDNGQRWRVIMLADEEMDKDSYKNTVAGTAQLLGLQADAASKKISQLMGYPLASKDITTVIGSMVNVSQFNRESATPLVDNVVRFRELQSTKSLRDFKHRQVDLLNQALDSGIPEGQRNETYYQIILFLRDTQKNQEFARWHDEAAELEDEIISKMYADGLTEKEVSQICR